MKKKFLWHFWRFDRWVTSAIGSTEEEAFQQAIKNNQILSPQKVLRYNHADKGNEVSETYYQWMKEREEKKQKIESFKKQLPNGITFFEALHLAAHAGITDDELAGRWIY